MAIKGNKEVTLSDISTQHIPSKKSYAEENKIRFDQIKKEPMVGVYGNPLYAQYLGDVYSFDYQDFPVTIKFDSKTHYYHKTIAEILQHKLDAAAMANVPRSAGDGDKL
jgi:hypothetical protein